MTKKKNDILQGTLVLLVLKTLSANGRMHGYAITSHIQQASGDLLRVEEGSLYPALHRMTISGMFADPKYGGNANKSGWKVLGFDDHFSWAAPFGWYDRNV